MTEVISVRFKDAGKAYYFDPKGEKFAKGENVVVETSRGLVYGEVTASNQMVPDESVVAPLRQVERRATANDRRHYEENCKKEKEALKICEQKVTERNLDMKLVDVEYAFEGGKILFYFTSDGRVDFRELVKDLASVFHTRIELRQIGVRDEAKMLGGLGICGQPFCCSRFLNDFHPVSIKMAKEQGLSLNPVKISGTCGRLMCCLNYEQNVYDELLKITPKVGATVKTPQGVGTVMSVSLLEQRVKVRFEDNDAPIIFDCCDVKSLHRAAPKKAENDNNQSQDSATEDN